MESLLTVDGLIALLTLTFMEIILGIDNIVFISIVTGKLPIDQQPKARSIGLLLALGFRIMLLMAIKWIVGLTTPIATFSLWGLITPFDLSIKDLILITGGLFLIAKSVSEMHDKLEGHEEGEISTSKRSFIGTISQIVMIDIVFSFDSILTAVGLSDQIVIMIAAVIIAMVVMLIFSGRISDFINKRPTMKMLALAFLILIGFMLVIEGMHQHVDKGYIYFAMAFSMGVELLNSRLRTKSSAPVQLKNTRIVETVEN